MQLERLDNLSDDDKENAKKMWSELKHNADDMKNMGKEMLKQKMDDKNMGNGRNR
jgi:hypothetical protein